MTSTKILVGLLLVTVVATGADSVRNPNAEALQEMFDLSARRTKMLLEVDFINKRLAALETEHLSQFAKVAEPTGSEYWESVSDDVVSACALEEISTGELLLYHPPGIYRVKEIKPKLTTEGECWYFRPNRNIRGGQEFSIVLVHDAPEELQYIAHGFAPHSNRARDPERAYKTKISISGQTTGE